MQQSDRNYHLEGVTTIGDCAFNYCSSLTKITIPEGVTTIGYCAFEDCSSLTEITIPEGVTSIGNYAFSGCSSLTDVYYGGTESEWNDLDNTPNATRIHYDCSSAEGHWNSDGEEEEGCCIRKICPCSYERIDHTFDENGVCTVCGFARIVVSGTCSDNLTWTLDVKGTLTIEGSGEMYESPWESYRDSIKAVVIEKGVTSISNSAFYGCSSLTEINLPEGVTSIGNFAFYGCSSLTEINLPEGVTSIGNYAFCGCSSLTQIAIPEGVTSIGNYVFEDCSSLTEITIPEGVTSIGEYAFSGCSSLTEITIPEGVTSIGVLAFDDCSSLTEITIPESVTSIGEWAFYGCSSLADVYYGGTESEWNDLTITPDVTQIHYSCTTPETHWNSDGEEEEGCCIRKICPCGYERNDHTFDENGVCTVCGFASIVVSGTCSDNLTWTLDAKGTLTIEGSGEMYESPWEPYRDSIKAVVIEEGITSISENAFQGCSSLTEITIPGSVTSIGDLAFYGCSSLTDVYYGGTETQWDEPSNTPDITRIHYNCPTADGHWTEVETPPTCGETGVSFETCSCGYKRNEESIPATGEHNYESVVTPPTCDDAGYTTHTCANCGDTYTSDEVTAQGHDLGEWETTAAPTCTEAGIKRRECSRCDHFETEEITATGHDHEAVVTPPTCEENGYTTYTCANCGDTYTGDETATEGHIWSDATCTVPMTCSVCHATEGDALYHDFGTWVVTKQPSVSEEGQEVRACTRCGHEESRTIEKLSNPFIDVKEGDFFYDPIMWAVQTGITTGATPTTFDPNGKCLRAHVVTLLHRAAGNPEPTSTNNPFTDVASSSFFYKPVLWAVEKNITNGTSATTFGSYANCNRAAVVTFLWRAAGSPEPTSTNNPFVDVANTSYYYKAVLWAVESGITNGIDATHFGPTADCNRAQVVTFLYRSYIN